ncbi:PEP-CTERM sorting domain-containing protein [bacterium]|nr:PEP-CTERM sorting domain-containing protein [bacterium]
MKKVLGFLMFLAFIGVNASFALSLPPIPEPFTGILKGESQLYRPSTGQSVFVDWIVSDTDLVPQSVADSDFYFSLLTNDPPNTRGDKAAYDASTYYYYYQLENDDDFNHDILNTLSVDLDPGVVLAAGYIVGLDLDNDLITDHNLIGEEENNHNGELAPDESKFTSIGSTPHQNWAWNLGMDFGDESTILFLSCVMPPAYGPTSALSGSRSYDGFVPVPHLIPEPMSMLLLASGVLGMFLRRKRK